MASITRRGDLQWQARVRRKGYPIQIKTFNTRAEAEAWARQIESEIDRGVFVSRTEAESTTLCEVLDRYERGIVSLKKGKAQEISLLKMRKATPIAQRSMASVRSSDVAKLRDDWLRQTTPPLKPASVLRRLAILFHVFSIVRKEWGMESLSNPLELVRKPPANNARTRRVREIEDDSRDDRRAPDGELKRVVSASGSDVLPTIISLAVETAMRRGEIVDLRWEHVDLNRHVAHLQGQGMGQLLLADVVHRARTAAQTVGSAGLFVDAKNEAAAILSLIATAQQNGHEPHAYLTDVLTRLPTHPDRRIGELLPHIWQPIISSPSTPKIINLSA
jgi:integrase